MSIIDIQQRLYEGELLLLYQAASRNKMKNIIVLVFISLLISDLRGQTCTSNPSSITSAIDFDAITWTPSGGATASDCTNMANGTSQFIGDVIVDLDNGVELTVNNSVDIDGNFPVTGGPGSGFTVGDVSNAYTFQVSGNVGDATNNGVLYSVPNAGTVLNADGTLFAKNNNDFSGNGNISGGTLEVKNGSTCPSPCPVSNNFTNCIDGASESFCEDNSVVLPIVLGRFNLVVQEKEVELEWQTISEQNFDFFSIERSEDGQNFYEIGTVPGHGNSNDPINYSFVDENPLFGTSFYRLNAIDYDGTYEKFQIVSVEFIPNDLQVAIYPNPGNGDNMTLRLGLPTEAKLKTVSIFTLSGEQVLERVLGVGKNELELHKSLGKGFYFAKIQIDNFTTTRKLIIN